MEDKTKDLEKDLEAMAAERAEMEARRAKIAEIAKQHNLEREALDFDGTVEEFQELALKLVAKRAQQVVKPVSVKETEFTESDAKDFVLARALTNPTKYERELLEEAREKAFLATGQQARGTFVPYAVMRAVNTTTNASLHHEESLPVADPIAERLVAREIGANVISGLNGEYKLPVILNDGAANAPGEGGAAADGTPTSAARTLKPVRVASQFVMSRETMHQTSPSAQASLENSILRAVAEKADSEILGNIVTAATAGAALGTAGVITYDEWVAYKNAARGSIVVVGDKDVSTALEVCRIDTGSGAMLMSGDRIVGGYSFFRSDLMPTKIMLLADPSECYVGLWGDGIDLIVDEYTRAGTGEVVVTASTFIDSAVAHPAYLIKVDFN